MYLFKSHLIKGHPVAILFDHLFPQPLHAETFYLPFFADLFFSFTYLLLLICVPYWSINFMKAVFRIVFTDNSFSVFRGVAGT